MTTILVTGGSGCIGQHIIKHFEENVENVDEIRVLDLQKFEQKLGNYNTTIGNTIPVSTITIDLVFENCFLSAMAPYVYSRDGRSLSIYGSECQI
jgi:nucleoside-diphosphate-sugar epimerase